MFDKKSKAVFKTHSRRKNIRSALIQMRSGPHCAVCDKKFTNSTSFEEHLKTREHKVIDSPLEFILERMEESANLEYQNLRRHATYGGEGSDNIDISGVLIGVECVSSVQVSFCKVCSTFVPEEGDRFALKRHCATPEHLRLATRI